MRENFSCRLGVFLLGSSLFTAANAQITADFSDHTDTGTAYDTSNNTGQTTAVDQFSGIAGDGWTSGWTVESAGTDYTRVKTVQSSGGPVNGAGNYLELSSSSTASGSPRWSVHRDYGSGMGVDINQAVTISFLYRLDDTSFFEGGGSSFVQINDGARWVWNIDEATWAITSSGGTSKTWAVADGAGNGTASFQGTGLAINQGDTYSFLIYSDPTTNTWDVTITNLDTTDSYSTTGLGYALDQATQGGSIRFLQQVTDEPSTPGTTFSASIDSIAIVPEPSSIVLIGLGMVGVALASRFRAK